MRTPSPNLPAPLSMPSVAAQGSLGLVLRRWPVASCTCRGCFCSNAGRGGRAKPRPVRCRVACCGVLMGKAEEGALSGVTDAGLRLPVHRYKRPGDRAGQCKGKCRYGPYSEDIPPPAPFLSFPGQGLQPHSFTPLSDHNRSQGFTAATFATKFHLPPIPTPVSSRCQS